jgi:hypothetical protein
MTLETPLPAVHPPIFVRRTLRLMAGLWPWFDTVCRHFDLAPELLLAVVCVESATVPGANGLIAMSNQALACMARWYPDLDTNPITLSELAYAAAHLRRQCRRFTRLTLALAAFSTDPDWVEDRGEAMLDVPEVRDYLRRVFATLSWLSDTQPWRPWDACPRPPGTQPKPPQDGFGYADAG